MCCQCSPISFRHRSTSMFFLCFEAATPKKQCPCAEKHFKAAKKLVPSQIYDTSFLWNEPGRSIVYHPQIDVLCFDYGFDAHVSVCCDAHSSSVSPEAGDGIPMTAIRTPAPPDTHPPAIGDDTACHLTWM